MQCALLAVCLSVVTAGIWPYIISDTVLPIQFLVRVSAVDEAVFDIKQLVRNAITELNLPGIVPKATANRFTDVVSPSVQDGISTITFGPYTETGVTKPYPLRNRMYIREIDVTVNPFIYPDSNTLYLTILHELGHVYGLDHPRFGYKNTVMGSTVLLNATHHAIPITYSPTLTQYDVLELYKVEILMYRMDRRTSAIHIPKILHRYPRTLTELSTCETIVRRTFDAGPHTLYFTDTP